MSENDNNETDRAGEVTKLFYKEKDKLLCQGFAKFHKKQLALNGYQVYFGSDTLSSVPHIQSALAEMDQDEGFVDKKNCVAYFVTWAPDPELNFTFDNMIEHGRKIFKMNKGILAVLWCVEQRGEDEETLGLGPHIHGLIYKDPSVPNAQYGRVKRRLDTYAKKYRTKTSRDLDVKQVSERGLPGKIAYVKGDKTDLTKQVRVKMDKLWRANHKQPDYYFEGESKSPLGLDS